MDDDYKFLIPALLISFAFTIWLDWYAIIPIVIISFCFSIYQYIDDKHKEKTLRKKKVNYKKMTLGDVLWLSAVLSIVGIILIAVCLLFKSCINDDGPSYERIERRTKIHTPDGDKMPTMSEQGEYHNAGTGERQIEYGGSKEQEQDIKAADRLIENGY